MEIYPVQFSDQGVENLKHQNKGTNWPVVYILHNDDTAYIGETCNIANRLSQHIADPNRNGIEEAVIITDNEFNKSVTLDIEQNLIRLCKADKKFDTIQNRNDGQSASHEYYNRNYYEMKMPGIWKELVQKNLAKNPYGKLINDALFKYSPYTCLNEEQMDARFKILRDIDESIVAGDERTFVVNGGAGTGKTILALNLLRTLSELNRCEVDELMIDLNEDLSVLNNLFLHVREKCSEGKLKVAYCVPMGALRGTLSRVLKEYGLGNGLIMNPGKIANHFEDRYDVVIVDEAHRIKKRKNIQHYKTFDDTSKKLGLDPMTCSQLDWIMRCSKYRILFYDEEQTVKGSDIG